MAVYIGGVTAKIERILNSKTFKCALKLPRQSNNLPAVKVKIARTRMESTRFHANTVSVALGKQQEQLGKESKTTRERCEI